MHHVRAIGLLRHILVLRLQGCREEIISLIMILTIELRRSLLKSRYHRVDIAVLPSLDRRLDLATIANNLENSVGIATYAPFRCVKFVGTVCYHIG